MASTIKVDNIKNQNGETFNTVSWDTTAKTSAFTAVSGKGYFVNTTSTAITATLPASPLAGDTITFSDYTGTFQINNLTIDRNGSNIRGSASNFTLNKENQTITLVYVDATEGWNITQESNNTTNFLDATGGTTTICGDYKIHTFTGPGTFCVSSLADCSSNNQVDYLVVAGGGGGGGGSPISVHAAGGGGAGGLRYSASTYCNPAPAPSAGSALPVSITAYPITVGSGGSGSSPIDAQGTSGNNSIFSTITSAGGGGGGTRDIPVTPVHTGVNGGSGGGGSTCGTGGTGNTPPVAPPQGNNGGNGGGPSIASTGGGGGAGAIGEAASPTANGSGGNGLVVSINGSSTTYAGGGGGGGAAAPQPLNTAGTGGTGGGGNGGSSPADPGNNGATGTLNTGGGGGGAGSKATGGAGGSGIVIIRYKFQ